MAGLRRADLLADPLAQFRVWFDQATGSRTSGRVRKFLIRVYKSLLLIGGVQPMDMNAMTLATVDAQGQPSARIVLLKGLDERGFLFYTNYESRKGTELEGHPHAALVFYWPELERQVCVAGKVERLPGSESDAYFHSRPRGSQVGAWASDQSRPVADRAALEEKWRQAEARFLGREVDRPPHWGGFVLVPSRLEFWQGRPNRLHDRFCYLRSADGSWSVSRLCP